MKADPKTIRGDIIASLHAKAATFEELCDRIDGNSSIKEHFLWSTVNSLMKERLVYETKAGYLHASAKGIEYITERGYLS